MTEYIVAARELGLLALLVYLVFYVPRGLAWATKTWLDEQEKNRRCHLEVQERMDARADKFVATVDRVCRYRPPKEK